MLQSRLGAAGIVISRNRGGAIWGWRKRFLSDESAASQGVAPTQGTTPLPTGRSADPAVHASELTGDEADAAAIAKSATKQPRGPPTDDSEPISPPTSSSPKLAHTEVGRPSKPNTQQSRSYSKVPQQPPEPFKDINCAGLDGSPWPDDAEGQKAQKRAQEADNKEYFKDHKASPLSEIEFADSRKPITQATDHKADNMVVGTYYGGDMAVTVWRPEQQLSAEETLLGAAELWQWNKMRGDPDSPHGRVLRALRGEYW